MNFYHYALPHKIICLDDYIQTMTIGKPKTSNQIKVSVQLQEIGNMSLHISNLLRGRVIVGKLFFIIRKVDGKLNTHINNL